MAKEASESPVDNRIVFPPAWVIGALRTSFKAGKFMLVAAIVCLAAIKLQNVDIKSSAAAAETYWNSISKQSLSLPMQQAYIAAGILTVLVLVYRWMSTEKVYLLDFECFRPPDHLMVTDKRFIDGSKSFFDDEAMDFQKRILNKSGLSKETFFPPGLMLESGPQFSMHLAREEAELVMFNAVQGLLEKTGIKARQVDILVVNCSLFNPTPSLSAMIINHFNMRSDIEAYNLGGMGCSAGIISVNLARKLLRERGRGGYALVVSTENITQNWYRGSDRSMLIPNTIFRMGSAAVMLTNKPSERSRSKYELQQLVRVHLGADDVAYKCVYQHADGEGNIGVELNRDLVKVAGKSMEVNLTRLGPLVLPWSEKLVFAANWMARKILGNKIKTYVPDFRQAFDHFCLHVGGRGVVEGLSKQLGLSPSQMSPSANTLYWYGNTSSSTVWYSFGYIESVQGVKKGDIVWQIGFGSGFKCNSAVWKALRPVKAQHTAWKHIVGREDEAMDNLKRIQAEAKQAVAAAPASANGHAKQNGNH